RGGGSAEDGWRRGNRSPEAGGRRHRAVRCSRPGRQRRSRIARALPRAQVNRGDETMAKNGFRVMDSDLHTMEPDDLWERYLDAPFKKFAPKFERKAQNPPNQPIIQVADVTIGEASQRPKEASVGIQLHERSVARHPHNDLAMARNYDAETHLMAMDIEGIDVAVIYGTRGRQVQMHDDLDPQVAGALARAHNNWTRDYCALNPQRLKFAAQLTFHDVGLAVDEARRAVRELGAIAIIGNP